MTPAIKDTHHEHVYHKVLDAIIAGLTNSTITEAQLPEIADYVLRQSEKFKTPKDIEKFTADLSHRWPIFLLYLKLDNKTLENTPVSKEHITFTEHRILDAIIAGLKNSTLRESQLPEIANYVLEKMPSVKTHRDLNRFLENLSDRWPTLSIHYLTFEK